MRLSRNQRGGVSDAPSRLFTRRILHPLVNSEPKLTRSNPISATRRYNCGMDKDFLGWLEGQRGRQYELHRQHINPAFVKMLKTIGFDRGYVRGEGCYLWDAEGNKYLDLLTGWGVFALGRNHPKVKALRATKQVYLRQLEEQIAIVRSALQNNLKTAEATRDQLTKRLAEINQKQLSSKNLSANYARAKNSYIKEKTLLDGVRMRAQTQTMELAMPRFAISVKEAAEPPTNPARPRVSLNLMLGALVGLVVGLGLAFFIEYLDTSVKTMEDVENLLGVPVLAIIPKNIRLLHREAGDTPDAEAYRILRTNIEFNRKNPAANTISVVSGGPGEGKSTTIGNLAFISAQGGYSTLIVDADLRRPVQHELFDVGNEVGLTNYLTTDVSIDDVIMPTGVENLSLLPSGTIPSDAVGILNSQRMSDLISELKLRYDTVLFDSPPVLGVSDASVLASEVDQTIIVVQHRRFPRAMLLRVKQAVLGVGGTVLGVVLNNVDLKHDQNYYYYTSYYGYYSPRDKDKDSRRSGSRRQKAAAATGNGASGPEEY